MVTKTNKIHLWFPNIFEFKGGIQVYSAFLLKALQKIYTQFDYNVFLKHDTRTSENIAFLPQTRFHFSGNWSDRWRTSMFALQLLAWGIWQRPQLVITTHVNFTLAAYWLKSLTGTPYWTIAHGVDAWNITSPAKIKALQHADRILAVSNYTRDRLIAEQDFDPDCICVLPNTFDIDRWQIAPKPQYLLERYGLTSKQPVILTVARLASGEQYKGYDLVVESLIPIRASIPNVHYIIVGKGNDRQRIEQLIADLNLDDCVTLAGFVPDTELNDHYNLCDVFAMPSQGEGFGIVYLEALACGKPILAGNCDGSLDALNKGELGVLVDPQDCQAIAQSLIKILQHEHPNRLIYQSERLRQKVIAYFGFEHFQHTLEKYLIDYLNT